MTASVTKLEWHKPKIVTVETVGPLRCCKIYTLFDGRRIVIPNTPIVITTYRKFIRLMAAIVDAVADNYFTCPMLKSFADELLHHPGKARELRGAIGTMNSVKLGKALATLARDGGFSGYRLVKIKKERNLVLYQVQKG